MLVIRANHPATQSVLVCVLAGNILTAMCFDGVEAMEKEIRENIAAATAAMTLASDEEVHSVEEGVEGRDSVNAKNQRIPVPSSASLGFSLSSYALPIQILRLLVHGDYISDSTEAAAGADAATFTCKSEASALVRRYCSRRVGKTVERLCIDLEHEGATAWALGEVTRGLQDSDVQVIPLPFCFILYLSSIFACFFCLSA